MRDHTLIKDILSQGQETVCWAKGWVKSVRKSKKFSFITIHDGSCQRDLQVIADGCLPNYGDISAMLTGTAVAVRGTLAPSQGKGQALELLAQEVTIIGKTDETYPLQKKALSLEFLREKAHLRMRTDTLGAVFRLRHHLAMATHRFFDQRGLYYLNTPIITGYDAEGAGELFRVTAADDAADDTNNDANAETGQFAQPSYLAVSGQLEAECFALGLGGVYTFGPTFRSENSHTSRHLSEFWMVEPEVAFAGLDDVAQLAVDYLKHLIAEALDNCPEEIDFLAQRRKREDGDGQHIELLRHVQSSDCAKLTYTEAIDILQRQETISRDFEYPVKWGCALQTEHERYLAEKHFKRPVIVTDYPKECKAFYMKQNDDGKTVRAMDLLVPRVGEIVGGSQREENMEKLKERMRELNMDEAPLWWYLELRKYGSVPHSGFGLGFERVLMFITGMNNIRDVIPFPRTPGNIQF